MTDLIAVIGSQVDKNASVDDLKKTADLVVVDEQLDVSNLQLYADGTMMNNEDIVDQYNLDAVMSGQMITLGNQMMLSDPPQVDYTEVKNYFPLVCEYDVVNYVRIYHIVSIFVFVFIGHEISFFTLMFFKFAPHFMDPQLYLKSLFFFSSDAFVLPESHFFDVLFILITFRYHAVRCIIVAGQMFFPILPLLPSFTVNPHVNKIHGTIQNIIKNDQILNYFASLLCQFVELHTQLILNVLAFTICAVDFKFGVWISCLILASTLTLRYISQFLEDSMIKYNLYALCAVFICLYLFVTLYEDTIIMIFLFFPYYIFEIILGIFANIFAFIFL